MLMDSGSKALHHVLLKHALPMYTVLWKPPAAEHIHKQALTLTGF